MADVRIVPQIMIRAGEAPTYTGSLSTSNVYLQKNNGKMLLHFKKTASVTAVVTVETPGSVDGNAIAERVLTTVPATTGDIIAGPFPPDVYNDSVGDLRWAASNIDGLTVGAFQL